MLIMFENKDHNDNAAVTYNDDSESSRRRHSKHDKDRDKKKKKQHRKSKRRHSHSDSETSDDERTNEKRSKRRQSKKRKHREKDEDEESHLRTKKSKKDSNKKHKSVRRGSIKGDEAPIDNGNIPHAEQIIAENTTISLPQTTDCSSENIKDNEHVQKKQMMVPMTRQQYEQEQSQIRSVFDPESGRVRLVRGSGEIIESIVSRSQHTAINQTATRSDGQSYTRNVLTNATAGKWR